MKNPAPSIVTPSVIPSSVSSSSSIPSSSRTATQTVLYYFPCAPRRWYATFVSTLQTRWGPYVADILLSGRARRKATARSDRSCAQFGHGCQVCFGRDTLLKPARNAKGVKVGCGPGRQFNKYSTLKCRYYTNCCVDESG
jgi:hypothetical protein